MNDEIEFGEVEEAVPNRALRPDENRHYAVVAYGNPDLHDLPIFVDLDVLADMEAHSQADTSVELGGVLLGGSYVDERGHPFVVVTDILRAAHYESTKGSFKFTHDTWSAISRERDQFPPELQMVGWYHTHPDWGVFLSGMDLFICDHFFNKRLDIAYVIDPCRGDRGMFQWIDSGAADAAQRIRRTGGFFVTASRFRAAELEHYVAELTSTMPAAMTPRPSLGTPPAPVVHLHQPRDREPPWTALAVAGALALQLGLVSLIAWRLLAPPAGSAAVSDEKIAAAIEKLDKSLALLESRRRADLAEERAIARAEFLDAAFRELKGADDGAISRLQAKFDQTAKLNDDVAARDAEIREMRTLVGETRSKLAALEAASERDAKRLKSLADDLEAENIRLDADLKKKKQELTSLKARLDPKKKALTADEGDERPESLWWWIAGGTLAALVVIAGVWWIGNQSPPPPLKEDEERKDEGTSANQEVRSIVD
jgi:proteasome lid subunit RPN8/RPN11